MDFWFIVVCTFLKADKPLKRQELFKAPKLLLIKIHGFLYKSHFFETFAVGLHVPTYHFSVKAKKTTAPGNRTL